MSYKSLTGLCEIYYASGLRKAVIDRHGEIISLSSGINNLNCPGVIKDALIGEYAHDDLYISYTNHCGNKASLVSLAYEYSVKSGNPLTNIEPDRNICRTFGGTGALSSIFEYLGTQQQIHRVLVLGWNYSVFSWWCDHYRWDYEIFSSEHSGRNLPRADEVIGRIEAYRPDLIILTQPTNPTGECYAYHELKQILEYVIEQDIWFLNDCVTNMYNPFDAQVYNITDFHFGGKFPPKWILVNSFSKSRSLAGMRIGYVVADENVCKFLYDYHDSRFWSTQNIGSPSVAKDVLYRVICDQIIGKDPRTQEKIIDKSIRMFRRYMNVLCPFSQDLTHPFDNFGLIAPCREEVFAYMEQLKALYAIYSGNISLTESMLSPYIKSEIKPHAGFNFCLQFENKLTEKEFCLRVFEDCGIDFYTQSVFDKRDDMDGKDFYVRFSTALDTDLYQRGLERLLRALPQYCEKIN